MTLNMAVLAPIPSAIVITMTAVNPGLCRKLLRANRTSFMTFPILSFPGLQPILFAPQSDDRVHAKRPASGQIASEESQSRECHCASGKSRRVRGSDVKEHRSHQASQSDRAG